MGGLADIIKRHKENENRSRWLGSYQSLLSVAEVSIPISQLAIIKQTTNIWRDTEQFATNYNNSWNQIRNFQSNSFENWLTYLNENKNHLDNITKSKLINRVRSQGVKFRWNFERLFADYIGYNETNVLGTMKLQEAEQIHYKPYTPEEFIELLDTGKVKGVSGHHINSVGIIRQDLYNQDVFDSISDPDNILLTEPNAHNVIHSEAGGFREPTEGSANEVNDRFRRLVKSRGKDTFSNDNLVTASVFVGVVAGLISAIIKYRNHKDSSDSIMEIVVVEFVKTGVTAGFTSYIATSIGQMAAKQFLYESFQIASFIGFDASGQVINSLIGSTASFAVFDLIRLGGNVLKSAYEGDNRAAYQEIGNQAVQMAGEQIGFLLLGIVIDSFTPIPDPVVGPLLTVSRIVYRIGKTIGSSQKNKASQKECIKIRLDYNYVNALKSIGVEDEILVSSL